MDAYRLGYKAAATQESRFGEKTPLDSFSLLPLWTRLQYSKDEDASKKLKAHIYKENLLGQLASYFKDDSNWGTFSAYPESYHIRYRDPADSTLRDAVLAHELEHKRQWESPEWADLIMHSPARGDFLAYLAETRHMLKQNPKHEFLKTFLPQAVKQHFDIIQMKDKTNRLRNLRNLVKATKDSEIIESWKPTFESLS